MSNVSAHLSFLSSAALGSKSLYSTSTTCASGNIPWRPVRRFIPKSKIIFVYFLRIFKQLQYLKRLQNESWFFKNNFFSLFSQTVPFKCLFTFTPIVLSFLLNINRISDIYPDLIMMPRNKPCIRNK